MKTNIVKKKNCRKFASLSVGDTFVRSKKFDNITDGSGTVYMKAVVGLGTNCNAVAISDRYAGYGRTFLPHELITPVRSVSDFVEFIEE